MAPPTYVSTNTVNIIPTAEQRAVSHQVSFNTTPAIGPPKNFNVLASATDRYFKKVVFIYTLTCIISEAKRLVASFVST